MLRTTCVIATLAFLFSGQVRAGGPFRQDDMKKSANESNRSFSSSSFKTGSRAAVADKKFRTSGFDAKQPVVLVPSTKGTDLSKSYDAGSATLPQKEALTESRLPERYVKEADQAGKTDKQAGKTSNASGKEYAQKDKEYHGPEAGKIEQGLRHIYKPNLTVEEIKELLNRPGAKRQ